MGPQNYSLILSGSLFFPSRFVSLNSVKYVCQKDLAQSSLFPAPSSYSAYFVTSPGIFNFSHATTPGTGGAMGSEGKLDGTSGISPGELSNQSSLLSNNTLSQNVTQSPASLDSNSTILPGPDPIAVNFSTTPSALIGTPAPTVIISIHPPPANDSVVDLNLTILTNQSVSYPIAPPSSLPTFIPVTSLPSNPDFSLRMISPRADSIVFAGKPTLVQFNFVFSCVICF